MRIGLDLDDVLAPWSQWAQAACDAAGVSQGRLIDRWNFHETFGMGRDELWETVLYPAYDNGMLLQPPYEGVSAILRALREEFGHTVHLATARGFEGARAGDVRMDTAYWLDRFEIPHDSLTFTQDKTLVNVDAFLDDSPANCQAMVDAGCEFVAMRRQPHNAAWVWPQPFRIVDDLAHFARIVGPRLLRDAA